jgi:hypothetical protein
MYPGCMDCSQANQAYSQQLGGVFQQVSPNSGVTLSDLRSANATLLQQCTCTPSATQQGPDSGQGAKASAAGRRLKTFFLRKKR